MQDQILDNVMLDVVEETLSALEKFGDPASLHEAYAVILEEVDELWEYTKQKQSLRDNDKIYKEAIQIAATSVKLALAIKNNKDFTKI